MSYPINLLLLLAFLILANLLDFVRGQEFCLNNGNYTDNSTYQTNLNTLLSTLSTGVDSNGFYNASVGLNSDRVYAMVLCRGDVQLDFCRSCVQNTTAELLRSCPNYMQATLFTEFCYLRYSNASMYGTLDNNYVLYLLNTENTTNFQQFTSDLRTLLDSLHGQASNGGSLRKLAAGIRNTSDFGRIYALEQCTPDLSSDDCNSCLETAAQQIPRCCNGSIGARILMPCCNLRYETGPFYNETRLQELVSLLSPPQPPPFAGNNGNSDDNNNYTTRTIIIVVVSVVASIIVMIIVGFLVRRRKNKKLKEESKIEEISVVESLHYDFGLIQVATNDFSEANKLGEGGFGAVYKGRLPDGLEIAVKRLSINSGQGDLEFKNEVMLLVRLQHRNLVRLLGFSLEGLEKLLVYEFVQNASLDKFLFDPDRRSHLDWDRRYKIIGGTARGILYLHEDSRLRIIHRDLKASNVLLDGDMNPKIADFGMARLFVPDETQGDTSRIVGTYGYMAPEYATRGQFSVKSDVFSFGVLLLEIITGQKNNCFQDGETRKDLISSAWESWRQGTAANLVDPVLRAGSSIPRDILRCVHIGLLCVQENATDRPTMASVVIMLNSFSMTLPMPSRPAFYVHDGYDSESTNLLEFSKIDGSFYRSTQNDGVESGDSTSQNEISISEFHGR